MVFILGGNGTHAGANAIHNEVYVKHIFSFKFYSRLTQLLDLTRYECDFARSSSLGCIMEQFSQLSAHKSSLL